MTNLCTYYYISRIVPLTNKSRLSVCLCEEQSLTCHHTYGTTSYNVAIFMTAAPLLL